MYRSVSYSLVVIFFLLFAGNVFADGSKDNIDIQWLKPYTSGKIEKNAMLELRVILDSSYNEQITHFIKKKGGKKLNPFNPEQLDIRSEFWVKRNGQWYGPETRYGFYYEEFVRDTTAEIENWRWLKVGMKHELRVRFTPRYEGEWLCRTFAIINQTDTLYSGDKIFTCLNSEKKGFMKVSDSRYFSIDGKSFLPIGPNMSHPSWESDPDQLRKGTAEYNYELRKMPAMPAAFVNYNKDIKELSEAGGTYFRMMLFPFVNDIEFEHLNDYSGRMHLAWEMDHTIQAAEEADLRIHFVLTWANELKTPELCYNKNFWDWFADDFPWVDDDYGYCYQFELGLKEPYEFLQDERAIKYYKYKLRYLMSRWGYSTSIGIVEMMNEINLVFQDHPKERMEWHRVMSEYLKKDLELYQPISVNYAGVPDINKGDSSYFLNSIDVLTFNEYRIPGLRSNFTFHLNNYSGIHKPFMFSEIGAGYGELCGCEVYSEWLKDAWMTSLSGLSSMGLEWSQQRNFDLFRTYYPALHYFMNTVDFPAFKSYESYSRKDKEVEVVAIKDQDGMRAAGVIQNTTWNYYTNRQNDSVPCAKTLPAREFVDYLEIKGRKGSRSMKLSGFKNKAKLTLEFYNTSTGTLISSVDTKSKGNGKVKIPYPSLSGDQNLIAFKLYPKGGRFQSPITTTVQEQMELNSDSTVGVVNPEKW